MARKRYKYPPSYRPSRPSISPTKPEFYALLELIEADRDGLPRRALSTLNAYLQTLESNHQAALEVIHALVFVSQEHEAALRLTLAQASLTRKQEERNTAHQAASWLSRWVGRSVPEALKRDLVVLQNEVSEAQRHLGIIQDREAKLRLQPFPLDSKANAQKFVTATTELRTLLYQAVSRDVRQAEEMRLIRDRALAAAHQDKTRYLAESVKKRLRRNHPCPYCNQPLGSDPHADHINPVSYGGLSDETNMVYVCAECNRQKSNLTLREFARKTGRNQEIIESRLEQLGKRV